MSNLRIALCQLNPTTGDIAGNTAKAIKAVQENDADIYIFPGLFLTNSTLLGASDDPDMMENLTEMMNSLHAKVFKGTNKVGVTSIPHPMGYNSFTSHPVIFTCHEIQRSNALREVPIFAGKDQTEFRISVYGEEPPPEARYNELVDLLIHLPVVPYTHGFPERRRARNKSNSHKNCLHRISTVFMNQVGGSDEQVFDGRSLLIDAAGNSHEVLPWTETVEIVELKVGDITINGETDTGLILQDVKPRYELSRDAETYTAACVALRDYVRKAGFKKVVLGLSGGADSALVGLMACDALGVNNVDFITMPSRFTSEDSNSFAKRLAYGISPGDQTADRLHTVAIQNMFAQFMENFSAEFGEQPVNVAEENLQAQLRGDILSFYSNKFGSMILSTGNKSEVAMGYSTLYGDMRGGFNPLKDIYKTEVFQLLEYRLKLGQAMLSGELSDEHETASLTFTAAFGTDYNSLTVDALDAIRSTIDRPPSAELAEGQKDSDSLPDYPTLDRLIDLFLGTRMTVDAIALETGLEGDYVRNIRNRIRGMEFKRFQACPGVRLHVWGFTSAGSAKRFPMNFKYSS